MAEITAPPILPEEFDAPQSYEPETPSLIDRIKSFGHTPQGRAIRDFLWFTLWNGMVAAGAAASQYIFDNEANLTATFGAVGYTMIVSVFKAVSLFVGKHRAS